MRCIIIMRPFAPDDPLDQDDAVHYPLPACGLQPPARRDLVSAARRTKKSKGLSLIGNAAATRTPSIGDCRCLCMPCRAKSPTECRPCPRRDLSPFHRLHARMPPDAILGPLAAFPGRKACAAKSKGGPRAEMKPSKYPSFYARFRQRQCGAQWVWVASV